MAHHADIALLIERIAKQDDRNAFRSFFDAYYQKMFRWAVYYVKTEQGAEEVVSDVFIRIWKNRQGLAEVLQLDSYLFTAIKRQSFNFIQQNNKRLYIENLDAIENISYEHHSDPEYEYLQQELDALIKTVVEKLPPRCRLIFQMVRLDGMKYKEVAELLHISIKTVENQLLKATLILRENVQSYQQHEDIKHSLSKLVKLLPLTLLLSFL